MSPPQLAPSPPLLSPVSETVSDIGAGRGQPDFNIGVAVGIAFSAGALISLGIAFVKRFLNRQKDRRDENADLKKHTTLPQPGAPPASSDQDELEQNPVQRLAEKRLADVRNAAALDPAPLPAHPFMGSTPYSSHGESNSNEHDEELGEYQHTYHI